MTFKMMVQTLTLQKLSANYNKTSVILTHCYGIPCDVEVIQDIADRNNLVVIYDARMHSVKLRVRVFSIMVMHQY